MAGLEELDQNWRSGEMDIPVYVWFRKWVTDQKNNRSGQPILVLLKEDWKY